MVVLIFWFLLFIVLIICDMSSYKTRQLIGLQTKMIAEEKYLWISMLVLIIFFVIIKVKNISLFEGNDVNAVFDNIIYSIIAAFVFYILSVFYPKSKTCLMMNRNIYFNVYRIHDLMGGIVGLFVNDNEDFRQFPHKFVNTFVVKKDKEHDKYTINPWVAGYMSALMPGIENLISALRSRYSDYLQPTHLSQLDLIEDVTLMVTINLKKEEMSYKEVEALFLKLTSMYITTEALLGEYKKYEPSQKESTPQNEIIEKSALQTEKKEGETSTSSVSASLPSSPDSPPV